MEGARNEFKTHCTRGKCNAWKREHAVHVKDAMPENITQCYHQQILGGERKSKEAARGKKRRKESNASNLLSFDGMDILSTSPDLPSQHVWEERTDIFATESSIHTITIHKNVMVFAIPESSSITDPESGRCFKIAKS